MEDGRTLLTFIDDLGSRGDDAALLTVRDGRLDRLTRAGLAARVRSVAAALAARGVSKGDAVALIAPGGADWVVAFLGIVAAGAVAVPLDTALDSLALAGPLRDSECRVVLAGEAQRDRIEAAGIDGLDIVILEDMAGRDAGDAPEVTAVPDDIAALSYTSGTTGTPKGVPLSHRNLAVTVGGLLEAELVTTADRVFVPLPLHHTYPLTVGVLAPLAAGAAVLFPEGHSGPQLAEALRVGGATVMIGVPRLYRALLDAVEARIAGRGRVARALYRAALALAGTLDRVSGGAAGRMLFRPLRARLGPDLRIMASGGAALDEAVWRRLQALGWEVLTGYGLTETGPILTFNPRGAAMIGTAGKPLPHVDLRIGQLPDAVGGGEDERFGPIEARGPNVFAGYRNRPEETAAAFTDDGWFRTGDLGFLDAGGNLRLTGRHKEMLVLAGGKNIFPDELEETYGASPLIAEVAVLERDGALVALAVPDFDEVRKRGAGSVARLVEDELRYAAAKLPSWQKLSGQAVIATPLPRTTLGKLRRHLLPDLYDQARAGNVPQEERPLSDRDRQLIETPPGRDVWRWLTQRFPDRTLHPDMNPQLDLGIDSLAWTGLGLELEDRFGVRLTEDQLANVVTLRDLVEAVGAASAAPAAERPRSDAPDWRFPDPPGPVARVIRAVGYALFRLVMCVYFRLRTDGIDNVPEEGPLMICANHCSALDPVVLALPLGLRRLDTTYFAGWTGLLFRGPISRTFSRLAQVLPVDPDRAAGASFGHAQEALKRGGTLVWFPEGRRSLTGELLPLAPGIGRLLKDSGAKVVPAYISGTFEAMPKGRLIPRPVRLHVIYGRPRDPSDLAKDGRGEDEAARIADALHAEIAALASSEKA